MKRNHSLFLLLLLSLFLFGSLPTSAQGPTSAFARGVELYEQRMYSAAQSEFAKVRNGSPEESTRADYYRAMCAAKLKASNAKELLQSFIKNHPRSIYLNEVQFALGSLLIEQTHFAQAYIILKEVSPYKLQKGLIDEYYFKLGYSAFKEENYTAAYNAFVHCTQDPVYLPHATYYKAYIDYLNDKFTTAKKGFSQIASHPAYSPIIPFYLLQIEFKEQNYPYVVEQGEKLLSHATATRAQEISRLVGESYFHLPNYEKAVAYLNNYEKLGGTMGAQELYLTGFCNYTLGNIKTAITQLTQVAGGDDVLSQNAAYHLADCYLQIGDKAAARQAFALAASVNFDPGITENALFNYGKLQYELGDGVFNEAINVLNRFLNSYPNSVRTPEAREYLLAAYFNSKDYEAAYDAIKLVNNPDNNVKTALQKIAYFRAMQFYEAGNYEQASALLDIAAANPYNAKYTALTKYWKGETLLKQGNHAGAIPLFKAYVTLSPRTELEHKMAHYNLGYCYFNIKNWSEASAWMNKFVNLYSLPDAILADAYNRLGDLNFVQRSYWAAIESYDKAIKNSAAAADYAQFQRAVSLGLVDRPDRKIESLLGIISNNKGEYIDDAMFELGRTYVQRERFNDGATILKNLVARFPTSPFNLSALSELGLTYHNLGNTAEALNYYKQVVSEFPSSPQAKDAMLGIRNIYVDRNEIDNYVAFAEKSGIETNITIVERDSLSFAAAERVHLSGDHTRSIPMMRTYLTQYERGAYRSNALFAIGGALRTQGKTDEALSAYEELIALPNNPFRSSALQQAARINMEGEDYADAAAQYRILSQTLTQSAAITAALGNYLNAALKTGNSTTIATAAEEMLASPFLTVELSGAANLAKGRLMQELKRESEALDYYGKAAQGGRTRDAAEAQHHIISILFAQGKLPEAESAVFALSEQNGGHQYWVGKSFLILGDIYLQKGDTFQAKATFQSIIDGYSDPSDGVIEEAQRKMATLQNKTAASL